MKNLYTILFLLFIVSGVNAQVETNYNAKWFLGFNTGVTWQTTDVENKNSGGWGLTLGKSFNYNYGRIASFDVRARFLTGSWYGQNIDTSGFQNLNEALSQGNTNYRDTFGYSVNNFQAEVYRFSLELVLHAHRIKERYRLDPYIFGGIGITWHQSFGDYLSTDTINGDQSMYEYDLNNLSKSSIKQTQDGVYETALDGNSKDKFNVNIMPSLGFGLGYQVAKAITIGVEHKTTFTGLDDFDGVRKSSKISQDLYHYSGAFIRFRLDFTEETTTAEEESQAPEVVFTQPNKSGFETTVPEYIVQANVKYVFDKENITFTQNGKVITEFFYNPKSDQFSSNVTLVPGQNVFEITGINQFGSDVEQTIVILKKEEVKTPPVAQFLQPSGNSLEVNNANFNLIGRILNITEKSQATLTVNGAVRNDFNFTASNDRVELALVLQKGNNFIELKGVNNDGEDIARTTIIYEEELGPIPIVYFTNPSNTGSKVSSASFTIRAAVKNVSSQNDIVFRQNGTVQTNFSFNPNSDALTFNSSLVAGQNIFEIIGYNDNGSASANTIVIYERNDPKPPVVNISSPNRAYYQVTESNFGFAGQVLNVTSKRQVGLKVNGAANSNFTFNTANGQVYLNLLLNEGDNTIMLIGTNNDGTDSKTVVINYKTTESVLPPKVQILDPNTNPLTVNSSRYNVRAQIEHVTLKSGVTIKVNGQNISAFNYNNGAATFSQILVDGANVIEVRGTNSAGTEQKSTTIYYRQPQQIDPPIVQFISPSRSPYSTNKPSLRHEVKVQNVENSSGIIVKLNGVSVRDFNYVPSSELLTFTANYRDGSNLIEVKGTNTAGFDQKSMTVNYDIPETQMPPTVQITNPSRYPVTVTNDKYEVEATVKNIENKNQIEVTQNGQRITSFVFNQSEREVIAEITLVEGENKIVIKATNVSGQASENTAIIKEENQTQPPVVTYTNPSQSGQTTSVNHYQILAKVFNVDTKNQIKLKQDGAYVSPRAYQFNTSTKELSYNSTLKPGLNYFEIEATNAAGSVSASTNLKYTPEEMPCDKPGISFISPASSGEIVTSAEFSFMVKVVNVNGGSVEFKLNGNTVSAISKPKNNYELTLNVSKGNNVLEVTVTNACGEAYAYSSVIYNAPKLPEISLIKPNNCPTALVAGIHDISGTVKDMTSNSTLTLSINGVNQRSVTTSLSNGVLIFSYNLNVVSTTQEYTVMIIAENPTGKSKEQCVITFVGSAQDQQTPRTGPRGGGR